ncbi:Metalloprotease TIKI1 [Liparis tanakae]|uniref:Metalloprotease TIKI n=1 Tax=Liparis tanakae TaxID=230148 RepID=A0A4Z2I0W2_9TELE|nr:Metalloprotease TIKI1 [Liparis tanakae]
MRGSLGAFIQSCVILLVRADQWRLKDSDDCELNKKQTDLNSFLWTIRRDPPSYFYGTIHVPYTRVWDFIPENSKQAFQESNIVYFELDLTDPYTISALTSCQLLPQGENLQDVLPRDIYRRLKRHLEYVKLMMPSWMTPDQRGKGLYADYLFNAIAGNWERKRPVWVMLMVNSLTEADIKTRGVPVLDLYLAQEAERMRKRTGAVEKVEEQCHPLNGLNFSQRPSVQSLPLSAIASSSGERSERFPESRRLTQYPNSLDRTDDVTKCEHPKTPTPCAVPMTEKVSCSDQTTRSDHKARPQGQTTRPDHKVGPQGRTTRPDHKARPQGQTTRPDHKQRGMPALGFVCLLHVSK